MINGFHEEKGDTAFKFASIILAMMALFVICMYVVIQVDSNSRTLDTKLKTTGIRRGLKAFLSSYSYDYGNLENIAEGYLKTEDLDPEKYGNPLFNKILRDSNPVLVNPNEAMGKFVEILSDNCGVSEDEIRNWNFQIVELHQVFLYNKDTEELERENYLVTYYKPTGNDCNVHKDEDVYSSADAVSNSIVDKVCGGKAQADLASDVYKTIHTKVSDDTYAKLNNVTNRETAATYTTFFFIGMNIPSRPVFGKKTDVTFLDLQSFSNQRQKKESEE